MEYPPFDAAFTTQLPVDGPDCSQHNSVARDECMPTNPVSESEARKPEKVHLYSEYLLRFCFASGQLLHLKIYFRRFVPPPWIKVKARNS